MEIMESESEFVGTIFEPHYPDRFTWGEYCVFGALLACSMGIGIFYGCFGKKNKTNEDFLMAGRSMPIFPVSLSLLCSFISAITLLGNPVEVYFYGMQYVLLIVAFLWMSLALAFLYVPVYYNLQLTSAFEYFEMRFDRRLRMIISTSQVIHTLLYMPTTVYGPAIALEEVAGIHGMLSSAIIFLVCIAYSSMGGLKAVLWTDVLQAFVMFGSMFSIIGVGISNMGGFDNIWRIGKEAGRTEFFNFDIDPRTRHTFWTGAIGGYFIYMPLFASTQAQIQRYLSVPTLAKARQCIFINMFGLWFIVILCSLAGLIIFATYSNCDPITLGKIANSDQLVPLFVMDVLGDIPLLPGLFVAGLTSGSLSTVSSALNSLAAVITEDYVKKFRPNLSETKLGLVSKIVSLVGGLIAFVLIFVIAAVGNILPFASVLHGTFIGPILGAATLGMFFPWANWIGVILGIIPSVAMTLLIGVGSILAGNDGKLPKQKLPFFGNDGCYLNATTMPSTSTPSSYISSTPSPTHWKDLEYSGFINFLSLSYMWQPIIPVVLTVVLGLIFSLIVRQFKSFPRYSSNYMSPPILKLWLMILGKEKLRKWIIFDDEDSKNNEKSTNLGERGGTISINGNNNGEKKPSIISDIYLISDEKRDIS